MEVDTSRLAHNFLMGLYGNVSIQGHTMHIENAGEGDKYPWYSQVITCSCGFVSNATEHRAPWSPPLNDTHQALLDFALVWHDGYDKAQEGDERGTRDARGSQL